MAFQPPFLMLNSKLVNGNAKFSWEKYPDNIYYLCAYIGTTKVAAFAQSTTLKNYSGIAVGGVKFPGNVLFYVKNGWCFVTMELTAQDTVVHDDIVCSGLPIPITNIYLGLTTVHASAGGTYSAQLMLTGTMRIYYPSFAIPARFDYCFSYPVNE